MSRLPAFDPDAMSDEQCRIYRDIVGGPRGVVRGPVEVWLHNPGLAEHAQALGAYCRFRTALPPRLSELAIIITAAHWRARYAWQSHAPMAIEAGLTDRAVEAVRAGTAPDLEEGDERAVYRFTVELLRERRVKPETWEFAQGLLGSHGVLDLIGILGYYALISMTIRAFEIGEPASSDETFFRSQVDHEVIGARSG